MRFRSNIEAVVICILITSALVISCSRKINPEAKKIADAYGFDRFDQVDAVMFTYNMFVDSVSTIRHWIWNVKEKEVHYQGKDTAGNPIQYSYVRGDSENKNPEMQKQIDSLFIHDQYWLFFPFHLVWDKNTGILNMGVADLPIPPGKANELVVQYPVADCQMPGDTVELFYDSSYQILQWILHRAGPSCSALTTTWEANSAVGPIMLSLERYNADSSFHVWFTGIAVKLQDVEGWVEPE